MGKQSREKRERRLEGIIQQKEFSSRHSSLEKVYFSIIELGTYLILFTPLILVKTHFFPFVSPKTIFFRILVDVIFIAYILLVISNRRYLPRFNVLTIAVTAFLGVSILTSLAGINFERSFWSTFERMTGLLTFFHLYAFFIILISVFRERKYWERILTTSILVGVILSFYVLFSDEASSRGGGTLGNTSFMSAYLLFDIFFAIILLFAKKGWWKIPYGLALAILLAALFFNIEPTRAAIGALFGGIFILVLGYMMFSQNRLLKRLAPIVLVLMILVGIWVIQTNLFKEKIIDIKDFPGGARRIVWGMAFEGWKERPWLGWGQENFNIPFAKYFNPELPLTYDVWYDRVHSIILDTLIVSGILGLLSYLAIFGIAIFSLLRICPKVIERRNLFWPLGMIALLIVYFFQNLFVFDMISSYFMFFLSLGFVNFLAFKNTPSLPSVTTKINIFYPFFGASLIILAIFTLYFGNIRPALTSKYIIDGVTSPLEKAIPAFQKAIKISPISQFEGPEQFSKKVASSIYDPTQARPLLEEGMNLAAKEMEKSIVKNPQDFRLYLLLGRHYIEFYNFTRDSEKLNLAEESLEKALVLSPKNQQNFWSMAQLRLFQEKNEESLSFLQKAIDLEPRHTQSHWFLALAYRASGKYELALQKVKDAEKVGYNWKGNLEDIKKVIGMYQGLGDNQNLLPLYLLAIERQPENAQFWAGLAVTYANLGQFEKARETAKKAIGLNPEFAPQLNEFLKSLPQ